MTRFLASLLLVLLASCGPSDTHAPPLGIGSVSWPQDATAAQAIFDRLPDELAGFARDAAPSLSASYGEGGIEIWAEDLGAAECPGLAGVDLVRAALGGDVKAEMTAPEPVPAGVPPYLFGTRPGGTWVAGWMVPGCSLVFAVEATSSELRASAVTVLVRAAGPA